MTLWLVRAGRYGEREDFALQNNVAVIGWDELLDFSPVKSRNDLAKLLSQAYPDQKPNTLRNWQNQLWGFFHEIREGDLIALPLKHRAVIAIGKAIGGYRHIPENPVGTRHSRPVNWLKEIPRKDFDQDLLYSLGAASTVCRITRNNAEARVRQMLDGKDVPIPAPTVDTHMEAADEPLDIEEFTRDQISDFINRKFKGHGLARLVGAVLEAQGYQVSISPEGADGGVDIIAGRGALGFEPPRLVVQVKSGNTPVDVGVLRELQGVMSSFSADQGLIVAWSGYRGTVEREAARQYFKIRLWDASDVVKGLQENYDNLPETIQAELPLKRIWALVQEEE